MVLIHSVHQNLFTIICHKVTFTHTHIFVTKLLLRRHHMMTTHIEPLQRMTHPCQWSTLVELPLNNCRQQDTKPSPWKPWTIKHTVEADDTKLNAHDDTEKWWWTCATDLTRSSWVTLEVDFFYNSRHKYANNIIIFGCNG